MATGISRRVVCVTQDVLSKDGQTMIDMLVMLRLLRMVAVFEDSFADQFLVKL